MDHHQQDAKDHHSQYYSYYVKSVAGAYYVAGALLADVSMLVACAGAATHPLFLHSVGLPAMVLAKGERASAISLFYAGADRGLQAGAEYLTILGSLAEA